MLKDTSFKILRFLLLFLLLVGVLNHLWGQNLNVKFKLGSRSLDARYVSSSILGELGERGCFGGTCYRWIQFESILDKTIKEQFEKEGIEILEFVSNNCYLLSIPNSINDDLIFNSGAIAIEIPDKRTKLDPRIYQNDIPEYAQKEGLVDVKIQIMPNIKRSSVLEILDFYDLKATRLPNHNSFIFTLATREQIENLTLESWVRYIDLMDPVGEPESVEGRGIQKANVIDNQLSGSGALSIDGDGVKILVRDDGDVGPHIDFQGRLWNDPSNGAMGTHGDGVAGVWAAAGNLDPTIVAAAPAADIYVIDYLSTFLDNTLTLHTDSGVVITNSSYSNGCNAGYTTTTVTVDQMAHDYPTLTHVFSAGNSNGDDCGYGAGNQWGNITGGHKQGKNVVTVANLRRDGSLVASSSRGPAHDGRIKPDLSGHGQGQISTDPFNQYQAFGGTSAAAPSTAGNLTQLYQAYKQLNGGTNPEAALIKACAMNSAQDLGQPGPDFRYGWGLIHGGRAYEVLENQQYLKSSLANGITNSHTINVPAGIAELRIMLYWNDPEASASASVALVNDLDLSVNEGGTIYLPRVLDHTPNSTSLDLPATSANAPDRLNNVEQVAISSPSPGVHTINVNGFSVPQGPQEYYIVYSYIFDEIEVTYPLGGECIVPGITERIHWDAYGSSGNFDIEFSADSGATWSTVVSGLTGSSRSVDWTPPTTISKDCLVRVSRAGNSDISDETFFINRIPSEVDIVPISLSEAAMSWTPVPDATYYIIFRLGDEIMEEIDTVFTNSYAISGLMEGDADWFSVSAHVNDIKGQRARAIYYEHDILSVCSGCFSPNLPMTIDAYFMDDFDNHCNKSNEDFDWLRHSGATPSGFTGPMNAYIGSHYLYAEASVPNNPNRTTILEGPCIDLTSLNQAFLQFNYHMYGEDVGSLSLEFTTDKGLTWTNPVWVETGDQGDEWLSAEIDLSTYTGNVFSYRFIAVTGNGFQSDMAIDNIHIDTGDICTRPVSITVDSVNQEMVILDIDLPLGVSQYDLLIQRRDSIQLFDGKATYSNLMDSIYILTGLDSNVLYDVFIRSICSENNSAWAQKTSFTTVVPCIGNIIDEPILIGILPFVDTSSTDRSCILNQHSGQASPDVFYQLKTDAYTDSLIITTCDPFTDYDTYIHLLDSAGNTLFINDDMGSLACPQGSSLHSRLEVDVEPNTIYFIVVEGYSTGVGEYVLNVSGILDCDLFSGDTLDLKVFMEGAFNASTGMMNTTFNELHMLPGQDNTLNPRDSLGIFATIATPPGQPYYIAPWIHLDCECTKTFGDTSLSSEYVLYPNTVVDWVLVSVREGDSLASSQIWQEAGLLHEDGTVSFPNYCSRLDIQSGEGYYVVVEHRNHLPVMSQMIFATSNSKLDYDFTLQDSWRVSLLGNPLGIGQIFKNGKFMMVSGNVYTDTYSDARDINSLDYSELLRQSNQFYRYLTGDLNFDGDINSLDGSLNQQRSNSFTVILFDE